MRHRTTPRKRNELLCLTVLLIAVGCGGAPPPRAAVPVVHAGVHALALGRGHACACHEGGTVSCWGDGSEGQLGDGMRLARTTPVAVPGLTGIDELAAGSGHTCARTQDGLVFCWGSRHRGQVGDGTASGDDEPALAPTKVSAIAEATQITAGDLHTCALLRDGTVWCWGDDLHGQLGRGGEGGPSSFSAEPVFVEGLTDVVEVRAGAVHTCARTRNGEIRCWGDASSGQLGETGVGAVVSHPVRVGGIDDAVELSLGARHSCARRASGSVACWGDSSAGQLGDGTRTSRAVPADVLGLSDAREIDAGREHTCARLGSGEVRCWGRNDRGQLGDGTLEDRAAPAVATATAMQLATGGATTCALDAQGDVACWGSSSFGQLGDGRRVLRRAPMRVTGLEGVSAIRSGGDSACARDGGHWRCWGDDAFGQLGDGVAASTVRASPVVMSVVSSPDDVVLGEGRACAIRSGSLSCWGRDTEARAEPTPRTIAENVRSAALGSRFACLLGTDGHVACWGEGTRGELGRGTLESDEQLAAVEGITDAVALAAGEQHACAVLATGQVRCWGAGTSGQLGDGADEDRSAPVVVRGIVDARTIVAGRVHTCVTHADGGVSCWGGGRDGQLGTGTALRSESPMQIAGVANVVALAAGVTHTCGLTDAGVVWCWGANRWGQIARVGEDEPPHPAAVAGVHASAIAAGSTHTCALVADGVVCWGSDSSGQLGDGATLYSAVPVRVVFGAPAAARDAAHGQT